MIKITIDTSGLDRLARQLQGLAKQVEFAKVQTLTQVAKIAAKDVEQELPNVLDRPTKFTTRSFAWKAATKANPESMVYIRPAAAVYLAPLITGGVVKPKKRALIKPVNVGLNQYGNLPPRKVKQLLARKDVFSGQIGGQGGIWQRIGQGRVKLLLAYQPEQQKRKQFDFAGMVSKSVHRNFNRLFERNFAAAMRTAR